MVFFKIDVWTNSDHPDIIEVSGNRTSSFGIDLNTRKLKELFLILEELDVQLDIEQELMYSIIELITDDFDEKLLNSRILKEHLLSVCDYVLDEVDLVGLKKVKYILDKLSSNDIEKYSLENKIEEVNKNIEDLSYGLND